jgi:hypothetical protein
MDEDEDEDEDEVDVSLLVVTGTLSFVFGGEDGGDLGS